MALTIQVGQTGTLVFTPHTVGVDPARITKTTWKAGKGTAVDFVLPDQITGVAPGVETEFHCEITLTAPPGGTAEKLTWLFDITCVPPGPTPPPPVVPVVIDHIITPPPPP